MKKSNLLLKNFICSLFSIFAFSLISCKDMLPAEYSSSKYPGLLHQHLFSCTKIEDDFDNHFMSCACSLNIVESHKFRYVYDYGNKTEHKKVCDCGISISEKHNFYYEGNVVNHRKICICGYSEEEKPHESEEKLFHDSQKHWSRCKICGLMFDEKSHLYEYFGGFEDLSFHRGNCVDCGYIGFFPHEFKDAEIDEINLRLHKETCSCGYTVKVSHSYDVLSDSPEDDEYHSFDCACGAKGNRVKHEKVWVSGETYHYFTCVCGHVSAYESHVWEDLDDGSGKKCVLCSYVRKN